MVVCAYVTTTISAAKTGKSDVGKAEKVDVAWGRFVKKFHKNFKSGTQEKTRYCVALLISLYFNRNAFESIINK